MSSWVRAGIKENHHSSLLLTLPLRDLRDANLVTAKAVFYILPRPNLVEDSLCIGEGSVFVVTVEHPFKVFYDPRIVLG